MITEQHRFRYSPTSDLAIGRDDQGQLYFQQWAMPEGALDVAERAPLGWRPYDVHHGLEEAEELLRLKAELDRLKVAPAPPPAPVDRAAVREVARALFRLAEVAGQLADADEDDLAADFSGLAGRLDDVAFGSLAAAGLPTTEGVNLVPELQPAGVDVGAGREVARQLRLLAGQESGLDNRRVLASNADRLDAALSGAGEGIKPDDPDLDGTDGAHPAWWRGQERGFESALERVMEMLEGKHDGSGISGKLWDQVRRWLATKRHRDLVELAAASLTAHRAHDINTDNEKVAVWSTDDAVATLAAIDAAEKEGR